MSFIHIFTSPSLPSCTFSPSFHFLPVPFHLPSTSFLYLFTPFSILFLCIFNLFPFLFLYLKPPSISFSSSHHLIPVSFHPPTMHHLIPVSFHPPTMHHLIPVSFHPPSISFCNFSPSLASTISPVVICLTMHFDLCPSSCVFFHFMFCSLYSLYL
jgi:hypothetical protein